MPSDWDELWDEVVRRKKAWESGRRGGVSEERESVLRREYEQAHRRWWDAVSNYQHPVAP